MRQVRANFKIIFIHLLIKTMLTKEQKTFKKAFLTVADRELLIVDLLEQAEETGISYDLKHLRSLNNPDFKAYILQDLPYLAT